jgi:hypothetical protein
MLNISAEQGFMLVGYIPLAIASLANSSGAKNKNKAYLKKH